MTVRVRVPEPLQPGATAELDSATGHHVVQVLRLRGGAPVEVVDGQGRLFDGTVVSASGSDGPVVVRVGAAIEGPSANPQVVLTVWLPLLKGGKTDDLIRQLTEVGASHIVPFVSERSVARLDESKAVKRHERWQTIADEATRQCRRTDRVAVAPLSRKLPDEGPGLFFYAAGQRLVADALAVAGRQRVIQILVGPEGGLSESEVTGLCQAGWTEAWLGPRILRAETAVVAASVIALQLLDEFR